MTEQGEQDAPPGYPGRAGHENAQCDPGMAGTPAPGLPQVHDRLAVVQRLGGVASYGVLSENRFSDLAPASCRGIFACGFSLAGTT